MSLKGWAIGACLCLVSAVAWASIHHEKGIAHVPYGGWSGVDAKVRATALRQAETNALDRYMAGMSGAEERNYSALRLRMIHHLGRFILGSSVKFMGELGLRELAKRMI